MLVYLIHRLMLGLVEENKILTCTILTHHLYRLNKCFSGTEPSRLVVSDRENIQGRHHLMSLRVGWIPVAAASSGSASPTVDENYRSVRVTNKNTKSEKNSARITAGKNRTLSLYRHHFQPVRSEYVIESDMLSNLDH